jgi:hypothetical protein
MALNFCHTRVHGKQISQTKERAMVTPAYFLILQDSEAFAVCRYANVGVKELQWGPVAGGES